jgi:hypothetical protein
VSSGPPPRLTMPASSASPSRTRAGPILLSRRWARPSPGGGRLAPPREWRRGIAGERRGEPMSATPPRLVLGHCVKCGGGQKLVGPLHLEKGGPDFCLPCGTEWHAEQARVRKKERRVLQALGIGGSSSYRSLESLSLKSLGLVGSLSEPSYAESHELTLELLEEAVRLTHPDRHPPERAAQAARVTADLLALKPYVLPKPPPPCNASATSLQAGNRTSVTPPPGSDRRIEELYKRIRPCEACRDTVPLYYCDECRAWDEDRRRENRERWDKAREQRNAKQRARRAWRRHLRPPGRCAVCGTAFKGKRKDAQYCSAACRQRAHRSCHATRDSRGERRGGH